MAPLKRGAGAASRVRLPGAAPDASGNGGRSAASGRDAARPSPEERAWTESTSRGTRRGVTPSGGRAVILAGMAAVVILWAAAAGLLFGAAGGAVREASRQLMGPPRRTAPTARAPVVPAATAAASPAEPRSEAAAAAASATPASHASGAPPEAAAPPAEAASTAPAPAAAAQAPPVRAEAPGPASAPRAPGPPPSTSAPPPTSQRQVRREHTVQKGDTLYSIARRAGTTVDAIVAANGLGSPDAVLPVGRRLVLP